MDLVTNAVKEAAVEASTSLLAEIKKHVAFLYKYKDNLEDLEKARILLDAMRRDASNYSVDAEKRFKKVGEAFVQWQSEADKLHQKAENIISKNNISCFHIWSRYSTSKHAWELTQDIHEKVDKAPDFGNSFDIEIPEGAKFNLTDFTDFDSRKEILKKVLKALGDEHVSMCSICGMGGIGKTTMAQNIVQIVEAGHFFDKVAMVTVSQNPNFENIQKAIMEKLGLPIGESDMSTRANKLNHWLSNHKTLLILDDVWDSLLEKFDDVGIPLAKNMCKIVVTSRNEHECKKMGSKPIFCLKVLDGREAWDLFIKIAGNLQETAREIVRECNGLPIAIVTIARALTDKPAGAWGDSLKKLRNSNLLGIPDMDSVYKKIEVSYDLLKDPEAQSCLRYCCLFPEDYNVPVEKLVFYGWGLELFKGVESLKEARDRVDSIVDKLKKSFLLLDGEGDGDGDGYVKLHDIVRDFAIWISLNDIHPYIVKCNKEMEKWPEACELEKCSAISIVCNTIQDVIPVELRCPNLKLLQLHVRDDSCELPIGFLEGMEELRVVDLQLGSRLPPLTRQKNLRTLLIKSNREWKMVDPIYLREMLGNGDMKNLEIFSLSYTHFSDFPEEIGKLCNLRCLRFKDHVRFEYIPPDVLSKLVKLEELRLPLPFINWGRREVWGDRRVNASLNETESLPLNSIDISVPKGSVLAEMLVSSITRFRISFGSYDYRFLSSKNFTQETFIDLVERKLESDSNALIMHKVDACEATANWTSSLLRKCDLLIFEKVRELKYIMFQQSRGNNDSGFPCTYFSHLKTLEIGNMNSLEEIWHGTYMSNIESAYFSNLTQIIIFHCQKLKRVFPLLVAMQLPQLQYMEIFGCKEMKEIFYKDQVDNGNQVQVNTSTSTQVFNPNDPIDQIMEECNDREVDHAIVLPQLKVLILRKMPKLRILCNGNHAIECPSLEEVRIVECNNMEALSYGSFNAPTTKKLELIGVRSVKNSITKWLHLKQTNGTPRVRKLQIGRCNGTKYLVDATDSNDPNLLKAFFSRLEHLEIQQMVSLEAIWNGPYLSNIQWTKFPNLTHITIWDCPKLKRVFPLSVATELRQLEYVEIRSSSEMEEIFYNDETMEESSAKLDGKEADDGNHATDAFIIFPQLRRVQLYGLSILRIFYDGNHAVELPSLETLRISKCYKIEALSKGTFKAPKLEKIVIDWHYYSGEDFNTTVRETMKTRRAEEEAEDKHKDE